MANSNWCASCLKMSDTQGKFCPNCGVPFDKASLPKDQVLGRDSIVKNPKRKFNYKYILGGGAIGVLVLGIIFQGVSHSRPEKVSGHWLTTCRWIYPAGGPTQQCTQTWVSNVAQVSSGKASSNSGGVHLQYPPDTYQNSTGESTCNPNIGCPIGSLGPGGGVVFYDAGSRQSWGRYIEVYTADHGSSNSWCSHEKGITDSFGTKSVIGAGLKNTDILKANCGATPDYSAALSLPLGINGFNDWFLPSLDELTTLRNSIVWKRLASSLGSTVASSTQDPKTPDQLLGLGDLGAQGWLQVNIPSDVNVDLVYARYF